jgi:TRAP transporter TAXI family solute receptor
LASGLAKTVSEATPIQAVVQPHTGATTHLQLSDKGELDFAIDNAVHLGLAYQQVKIGGRNPIPHSPNIRLVMRGSPLLSALLARKDVAISIYDVKGKRVAGEYPAQLIGWYATFGALASAGLTWNDVKVVPVPAVLEAIDAVVQGRADVGLAGVNSAKVKEADAARGVRYIAIDCSPQGEDRLKTAVPGFYPRTVQPGRGDGAVVEDSCVIAFDMYLLTHKAASDQVVMTALRAIWDNVEKLAPLHPTFKEWTRERAVDSDVTIPYHPGAIRFYKERGVWSAKMDEAQRKLLALNP